MSKKNRKSENSGPVICFAGKKLIFDKNGKRRRVRRTAPSLIINGNLKIELPSSADQKRGFTHKHADLLLSVYPQDYKLKN